MNIPLPITDYSSEKNDYVLYLSESYADKGRFCESLDLLYHITYHLSIGKILPVISKIVDSLRQQLRDTYTETPDYLSCPGCLGVLYEPITIACGHTYCKRCLNKDSLKTCLKCQKTLDACDIRPSVLISSLVQKWWPSEVQGAVLRAEANSYFKQDQLDRALQLYSEANKYAPNDHLLLSNRSHTLLRLGKPSEALRDAESVISKRPFWAKGHFRKSAACLSLGIYKQALVSALICTTVENAHELPSTLTETCRTLLKAFEQIAVKETKNGDFNEVALKQTNGDINGSLCGVVQGSNIDNMIHEDYSNDYKITEQNGDSCNKNNHSNNYTNDYSKNDIFHDREGFSYYRPSEPFEDSFSNHINSFSSQVMTEYSKQIEDVKNQSIIPPTRIISCDVDKNDLECPLCYHLFWKPVTTPCGHSFCRACLDRSLDHAIHCPLCKTPLREYLAENRSSVTTFLELSFKLRLPKEYFARAQEADLELREHAAAGTDQHHQIPIFVATLAIPFVACPLHVFEPRYRLMVRRVMEAGTREFGMCMPSASDSNGYSDYGTMLEVREVRPMSDGRRVVNAIGSRRFRCVSKGTRDGYDTATIEFIKDKIVDLSEVEELKLRHDSVRRSAGRWFKSLELAKQKSIINYYGEMPPVEANYWTLTEGPRWLWWLTAVSPLDAERQSRLLRETDLKARLSLMAAALRLARATEGPTSTASADK